MKSVLPAILIVFILGHSPSKAQPKEGVLLTAGMEMRMLVNPGIFHLESVSLTDDDNNFQGDYSFGGGMGFGGVIRIKLTDFWNIETGINYTRRRFDMEIQDLQGPFIEETSLRVIGYELPLKGLVYIQMGKNLYMNVAMGAAVSFFASDVMALEQYFRFKGFKKSWARGSVLGSVGAEYRTEKDGIFYLGATYHQMLNGMMVSEIAYYREGLPPAYGQRGTLDGTYISLDFRYFFPLQKPKKSDSNVVKPDWKNM